MPHISVVSMIWEALLIGVIFIVVIAQMVTNKQIKKMKKLEKMFTEHEKSGLSVTKFCKQKGIHESQFYYWKPRYEKQKEAGLIDRRKGVSYKITVEIKDYIREIKMNNSLKSGPDIAKLIKKKFRTEISDFHVQRVLKELGLNDPVGRKTGKRFKKTGD